MRRWRRPSDIDEDFDLEDDEEEEEVRRYAPPRPLRVTRFSDFDNDDEYEVESNIARFDKIKGLIRAGKYKPKPSDPWMAHILYSNLKALGEI